MKIDPEATKRQLEYLATFDEDVLRDGTTLVQLRKMVTHGVILNPKKTCPTKAELVDLIMIKTADIRIANKVALETEALKNAQTAERIKELEAAKLAPSTAKGRREVSGVVTHPEKIKEIVEKIEAIGKTHLARGDSQLIFTSRCASLATAYLIHIKEYYELSSQKSSVTDMNKALDEYVSEMDSGVFNGYIKDAVDVFKYQVKIGMEETNALVAAEYKKAVSTNNKMKSNMIDIAAQPVIDRAVASLKSLTDYRDVSIATIILTGRRMGEILATLKYHDVTPNGFLNVSGLTKAKSDKEEALNKIHDIPVLADVDLLRRGMQYLIDGGFRLDEAGQVNNRYGKEMKRQMTKWADTIGIVTTFKSMRAFYASVCYKRMGEPSGYLENAYQAEILVHRESDLNTAFSYHIWNIID